MWNEDDAAVRACQRSVEYENDAAVHASQRSVEYEDDAAVHARRERPALTGQQEQYYCVQGADQPKPACLWLMLMGRYNNYELPVCDGHTPIAICLLAGGGHNHALDMCGLCILYMLTWYTE